jgi:cytochrome c oxidase cbb3-type subunit 3
MMNRLFSIISAYALVLFSSVKLMAQDAAVPATSDRSEVLDLAYNNILVVIAVLVLIGVILAGLNLIWALIEMQKIKLIDQYGPEVMDKAGWSNKSSLWGTIYDKLSGLKPLDQEKDVELDHEYDGIRELDNSLPPWWLYLFYITIIWGVGYVIYYHVGNWGPNQEQEYVSAMEVAEEQKAAFLATQADLVDEKSVTLLTDEASLAEGKEVYLANCVACHGAAGEGNAVGPNLTDKYWIHGGSVQSVFSTIKYGVVQKGMQAWQAQLRPQVMQKVASYILSLQGSNPPNAKDPQGDLFDETAAAAMISDTTKTDTTKVEPVKAESK